jgi:hypothetical protein
MNKEQARQLVKQTFQSAFDERQFLGFVKELTNGNIDESKSKAHTMKIPDAFRKDVKSCKRLGTYENEQFELVDILVVHVKSSFKLQRTRTALRNFVAHKLKRGEGDDNNYKDAGLIAFVSDDASEWRFSLVRMEYQTKRDPNTGKFKAEEQLTPARRYSYLVGPNEQSHTAQSRFVDLLIARGHPTVDQLLSAFSVEKVTNEFFAAYKQLFLTTLGELKQLLANDPVLADDFASKHILPADFAKKMLGQIVFLYFLQKKGWLGVQRGAAWGSGPTNFMQQLLTRAEEANVSLFNDILEPLFYDTLAVDRKGDDYWAVALECRIPFLNGGLFEPLNGYDWRNTAILLPNTLFTNQSASGIFDVFDRYNFTVDEAEPLESDVAIDPEMLGKVFENLLDVDDRAAQGAFYTPREIVHYMCQISLVHYLERSVQRAGLPITLADIEFLVYQGDQTLEYEQSRTPIVVRMPASIRVSAHAKALDAALAEMTVLDPAIGSGAFPVGMMTEIVRLRQLLGTYFSDHQSRTVYDLKRHTIQHSLYGVDIAQGAVEIAKLRLWLSLVVDEDDVSRIKPLPNLDFKIVVGNSLLGVQKNVLNHFLFDDLREAKRKFFGETDHDAKAQLKAEIDAIIAELTNQSHQFDVDIFFHEVMATTPKRPGGFDVVIGNPPYVQLQEFKGKPLQYQYKNAGYKSYDANGDLYCLFYEMGMNVLAEGASLCYITSNKWLRTAYGKSLRQVIADKNPLLLIDMGRGVFDSATVDSNIMHIENCTFVNTLYACKPKMGVGYKLRNYVTDNAFAYEIRGSEPWFITTPAEQKVKDKIFARSMLLRDWKVKINYGVKTGINEAFIISSDIRREIIDSDPSSRELIKPILRGRDIQKYVVNWGGMWIISTFPSLNINIDKYVGIKNYLLNNFDIRQLEQSGKKYKPELSFNARKLSSNKWYETQDSIAYHGEFIKEKIVWKNIGQILRFSYDNEGYYAQNSTCILTGENIKYLVAFLNSKVAKFFLENDNVNVSVQALEPLPIAVITPANQPVVTAIEACVERILAAKQHDIAADTCADEAQIDQLVYQLYDLTADEIALIEAAQPGVVVADTDDEDDG